MGQLDPALAQWVLDQARHHGASAAEVLLVSAESIAAGVRLGEVEDSPLRLAELPDEAEVDGVELVALAGGPGIQVLGKRLARLIVFGQPVAGLRTR